MHAAATCTSTGRQTNIQALGGALGILERLRVSFEPKPDGKRDVRFITENVAEVFPEAITYGEGGKDAQAVDCSRLVALLVEAVNEQQVQIKNQEHSLKEQKSHQSNQPYKGRTAMRFTHSSASVADQINIRSSTT